MSTLVSLDPGLRVAGLARFDGGRLAWAGLIQVPGTVRGAGAWLAMAYVVKRAIPGTVHSFVTEEMIVRRGIPPANILQLQGVAGVVCGILQPQEAFSYLPEKWGKQVPKPIKNKRVLARLTADERACIEDCPEHLLNNVLDGIGIGLFHLGRYVPAKAY